MSEMPTSCSVTQSEGSATENLQAEQANLEGHLEKLPESGETEVMGTYQRMCRAKVWWGRAVKVAEHIPVICETEVFMFSLLYRSCEG